MNSSIAATNAIPAGTRLEDIKPEVAWEAWQPTAEEPWNEIRVRFLFRRCGFGATAEQVRESLARSHNEAIESICTVSQKSSAFEEESQRLASAVRATGDSEKLAAWWLRRMLDSPDPLWEKMTLFWHGHFATGAEKVQDIDLMYEQNRLLRRYALGDFRALAQEISKDAAMLIYLDSVTNRKAHPNENYARELMELFCLGEGNYSEKDVQELARCFTGWEIRRKQFRFNSFQHDSGNKSLFGHDGIESGESAVDRVVSHPAMPHFIISKLFRFFICDEPSPSEEFLKPLIDTFVESKFNLLVLVKKMARSRLMLSMWSNGRRIRSPVELLIEMLVTFQATTNLDRYSKTLRGLGQALFYPPNVKGWDGGRAWINSSTLIGRANLIFDVVNDENTRYRGGPLDRWCKEHQLASIDAWIEFVSDAIFAVALDTQERERIAQSVQKLPEPRRWSAVLIEIANFPKIQLS